MHTKQELMNTKETSLNLKGQEARDFEDSYDSFVLKTNCQVYSCCDKRSLIHSHKTKAFNTIPLSSLQQNHRNDL